MTITQNGNVGIGTFNPQPKLELAGNAVQDRDKGGIVKAMLSVGTRTTHHSQCYNGITGAQPGGCGFAVTTGANGNYASISAFKSPTVFFRSARGINGIIGVPPFR